MGNVVARTLLLACVLHPAAAIADGYMYSAYAHRPFLLGVSWEYGLPTADLRTNFVNRGSPSGVQATVRYGLAARFSAGLDLSWNRFQQTLPTGDQARMDATSARATVHYYLLASEIQPYVGVGAGGVWRRATLGAAPSQTGFGFCVDPQVGVLLTVGNGVALNVHARYVFTTASFDLGGQPQVSVRSPRWVQAGVGVALY